MEPGTIELAGEVRFPGKYPIHQGETLLSVLQRAGGLTDLAFPGGAVFIREELKKREKDQLELLANRLQSDLAALSLEAAVSSSGAQFDRGDRQRHPSIGGRPATDESDSGTPSRSAGSCWMSTALPRAAVGSPDDVMVRDGDKLLIPKKTQEVTILGEVQSPTSHVLCRGVSRATTTSTEAAAPPRRRIGNAFMWYAPTATCVSGAAQRLVQTFAIRGHPARGHHRRAARHRARQGAADLAVRVDHHLQPGDRTAGHSQC